MSVIFKKLFSNLGILPKITLLTACVVGVILLAIFIYYIPYIENKIIEERRANVRNAVEIAHSVVAHFHDDVQNGAMDTQKAQSLAIEAIKDIRYPSHGYIWIHDDTPRMIMHPTIPDLDGENLEDFTDKTGYPMFNKMVSLTDSKGAGYVRYMWPKPNEDNPSSKLSYVKKFAPWEWVMGSGVYMDDVERELQELVFISIASASVLVVLIMLLAYGLGFNIKWRLALIGKGLHEIATGKGDTDLTQRIAVSSNDEIDRLAAKFNELIEQINSLRMFRKEIDKETRTENIYLRMAGIFTNDIGIERFRIYELYEDDCEFNVVLERGAQTQKHAIKEFDDILNKAAKDGAIHVDNGQMLVDGQSPNSESDEYVCVPLFASTVVFAVIQFYVDKTATNTEKDLIYERIDRAKQYIKEAEPVLESRRLMARVERLALSDPLTGLHNRRFLEECRDRLCAGAERRNKVLGLLMCDIDHFKSINDAYGHDLGDQVLVELAAMLSRSVRKMDLVIRMGGEEFLIVLKDVESGQSFSIAEKIRQRISEHGMELAGATGPDLTVSIGVAEYPVDGSEFEQVMKYADLAAYHAKYSGRNRCVRYAGQTSNQDGDLT